MMSTTDNATNSLPLVLYPPSPTNLTYSDLTTTSVRLSWVSGTGGGVPVAYYRVWEGIASYYIAQTTGNTTSIQLTNLTPDTRYGFIVVAIGTNGERSYSSTNFVDLTTPSIPLFPPSPVNLRATTVTTTSITLQWDTGNDGTAAVFRYRIYQDWIWMNSTPANGITITNLTPGTTYSFYIVSEGSDGQFGVYASNEIFPTTVTLARPPSPVNLRTSAVATGSVTLQWDSGSDGTEPVSFFRVYQNGTLLSNITGYTTTLYALIPNALYTLSIVAVAANGQESVSSSNPLEVIVGTAPALPPVAPLSALYQFVNATTAQLNIYPGTGGGAINGYAALDIYSQGWFFSPGSTPLITLNNLSPGQSYYFLVFAVGRDGQRSAGYAQAAFTQSLGVSAPFPSEGFSYRGAPQPDDFRALTINSQLQREAYDGAGPIQYPI